MEIILHAYVWIGLIFAFFATYNFGVVFPEVTSWNLFKLCLKNFLFWPYYLAVTIFLYKIIGKAIDGSLGENEVKIEELGDDKDSDKGDSGE